MSDRHLPKHRTLVIAMSDSPAPWKATRVFMGMSAKLRVVPASRNFPENEELLRRYLQPAIGRAYRCDETLGDSVAHLQRRPKAAVQQNKRCEGAEFVGSLRTRDIDKLPSSSKLRS